MCPTFLKEPIPEPGTQNRQGCEETRSQGRAQSLPQIRCKARREKTCEQSRGSGQKGNQAQSDHGEKARSKIKSSCKAESCRQALDRHKAKGETRSEEGDTQG